MEPLQQRTAALYSTEEPHTCTVSITQQLLCVYRHLKKQVLGLEGGLGTNEIVLIHTKL